MFKKKPVEAKEPVHQEPDVVADVADTNEFYDTKEDSRIRYALEIKKNGPQNWSAFITHLNPVTGERSSTAVCVETELSVCLELGKKALFRATCGA